MSDGPFRFPHPAASPAPDAASAVPSRRRRRHPRRANAEKRPPPRRFAGAATELARERGSASPPRVERGRSATAGPAASTPIATITAPPAPTHAPRRRGQAPWLVLGACLLLTLAATLGVAASARARDEARFENAVRSSRDRVVDRLDTYVALLKGGAALFDASGEVTRAEFRSFVERLGVRERYAGVQGIGFSRRLAPGEAGEMEARARAEGLPAFRLSPGAPRAERHAVWFLEPLDPGNAAALGYDMSAEPVRREAMRRARDTGRPAMSGRVVLGEGIGGAARRPGFLIYVPVYRGGGVPATVAERRARHLGFVYAAFRAGDLFDGVFASERRRVGVRVYDGPRADAAALLHDARGGGGRDPAFRATERITGAGRTLTLRFESRPAFEAGLDRVFVPAIALGGIVLSLLLFALARAQVRARSGAELRADALRVALAERERLVSIVESSGDFIGFASPEGEVLYLNAAGRRMVGLDAPDERLLGRRMIDFHAADDARALAEEVLPVVRERGRWQGEFRMRHLGTGRMVPIHLNLFTIPDPQTGETIGLGTVTRDITAQKRATEEIEAARTLAERSAAEARDLAARLKAQALELERQVEQARALNDELQRANRAKSSFLATMSHELRTPLNAVIGYADLMLAGIPEPVSDASRRSVERIALASRHLLSVIEEILSHARIEAGRETLDVEEVDLGEVLLEVVAIVEPLAAGKKLAFRAPETVRPESMATDARKLRQVLVNLLGNAVKFTERGEIAFEVEEAPGGWVEFRVHDTGIGIAEADQERIFEAFRQVDDASTRTVGGTGLGLSVSRHLARMMGGDVSVRSAPGEGSTFTLRLPTACPTARPAMSASSAALASAPGAAGRN
jgi:two-component system sensor histidine kinase/response regulator